MQKFLGDGGKLRLFEMNVSELKHEVTVGDRNGDGLIAGVLKLEVVDADAVEITGGDEPHERLPGGEVDHLGGAVRCLLKLLLQETVEQVVILAQVADHTVGGQSM